MEPGGWIYDIYITYLFPCESSDGMVRIIVRSASNTGPWQTTFPGFCCHIWSLYIVSLCTTPLKINGWNIIMEVCFRSCSFLFMGDVCRFQPLIFQGVWRWSICQHPRLDRSSVEQWPIHPIHLEFMSTLDVRRWEVQQFAPAKIGAGKTRKTKVSFQVLC